MGRVAPTATTWNCAGCHRRYVGSPEWIVRTKTHHPRCEHPRGRRENPGPTLPSAIECWVCGGDASEMQGFATGAAKFVHTYTEAGAEGCLLTLDNPPPLGIVVERALDAIQWACQGFLFRGSSEAQLQAALAAHLTRTGLAVRREVVCGPRDRLDLFVPLGAWTRGVAIECKLSGASAAVARQLLRYLQQPMVAACVLVTTRRTLVQNMSSLTWARPFRAWACGALP